MWTACATAMAMTMIGTPALAGLKTWPVQPAKPMVPTMTSTTTDTIASVAKTDFNSKAELTMMIRNTIGTRVCMSFAVASASTRCMTTSPVR